MKRILKVNYLPLVTLVLGILGFGLRKALYTAALDGRNLLLPGHPLQWLLLLVTAAALVPAMLYGIGAGQCSAGHKAAPLGSVALCAGIVLSVLPLSLSDGGLSLMRDLLGILAAVALLCGAVQQLKGQRVFFLFPAAVCIFFAVHMVSCYQSWSSNPQIMDYLHILFASVGLMLFAYQQSACAADCGSRKLMGIFGLISVFCGITALSGSEYPLLLLTGSIWILTNLAPEAPEEIPEELPEENPAPEETE